MAETIHTMGRVFLTLMSTLLIVCPLCRDIRAESYFFPRVRARIELLVNAQIYRHGFVCRGETICGIEMIPEFYRNRNYEPVWLDDNGLKSTVPPLIEAIRQADREGLNPSDYHMAALEGLMAELAGQTFPPDEFQANHWADFDLLLTDAFILLGSHLSGGRINPETLHADWLINEHSVDMLAILDTAVTRKQMEKVLAQLSPEHRGYNGLKAALRQMRTFENQGGWPQIDDLSVLKPGQRDNRVAVIRQRMLISGDLAASPNPEPPLEEPGLYDAALTAAMQRFQRRHGLDADGIVGRKTLKALNITADRRVRQIELNLERWRWLPRNLGRRHIEVNTADFSLKVMEDRKKVLAMRVVVGRPARRTPVFSSIMSYLVINPYWTIPRTIAVEDILPKLAGGIDYLIQQNIKVFAGWSEDAAEIDPHSVPWHSLNKNYFPIKLRQEPGANNAMGRIKFIFPNKFAVYLHDTPQHELFHRIQRDFSSGCIRVENAAALAGYLLSEDPFWSPGRLQKLLEKGKRRVVRIPRPIPVHLLYMTAWVDENNVLQFRNDIYHRDRALNAALLRRKPYLLPPLSGSGRDEQ